MPWDLTGNSGTSTSSFLGTIDARPLIIKTNSAEAMRVGSDGKLSIGSLGGPRSPDYKLDIQGVLNADEIYKGGAPLVESQWTTLGGGITYEGGEVGIGARVSGYRLNVDGVINAADIHKGGSPLVGSQWEEASGGISYSGGSVGIGTINASYRLNVDGAINATEFRKNGSVLVSSQWSDVAGVGIRYNAFVGLGKAPASPYKLDVAGSINATDIHKNGRSLIESQWTSAASGDISYVGGNVGIGTAAPLYRLHAVAPGGFGAEDSDGLSLVGNVPLVAQSNSTAIGVINGNGRQAFALNIDYNGGAANTRGIPTFYDKYDGVWHQCLSLKNGNVGIGTYDPQGKLDVRGDIRAGNSDIYFTRADHNHTGIGNTAGYAAIENAANFGALMILGRAGTSRGRYVRLWDYLQVNGGMDVTGPVGVGTAGPQVKLHAVGNRIRIDNGGGRILDLRADGAALDLESNGADLYINNNGVPVRIRNQQSVSSRDLKENIVDFTTREATEALEGLNPVSFTWKDDGKKTRHIGFIAEDAPGIARSTDEKAIIPVHILAILSKVVQEQQRAISALRRELDLREAT